MKIAGRTNIGIWMAALAVGACAKPGTNATSDGGASRDGGTLRPVPSDAGVTVRDAGTPPQPGPDAGRDGGSPIPPIEDAGQAAGPCSPDGGGSTVPACNIVGIGSITYCGSCLSFPDGGFLQVVGQDAGVGYAISAMPSVTLWCDTQQRVLRAQRCDLTGSCGFTDDRNGYYCTPEDCSPIVPAGSCDDGLYCENGSCASQKGLCSTCTTDSQCAGSGQGEGDVYCRPLVTTGAADGGFVRGNCGDGGACYCLQDCSGTVTCPTATMCNGGPNYDCIPQNLNCASPADAG